MRVIALLLLVGCASPPSALPQAPGLDGLRAHLIAARAAPERAVDGWLMPTATWDARVTDAYRAHHDTYRGRLVAARASLIAALRASPDTAPRWQYADDPTLSPPQIRLRWVLPVGQPGAIADGLPVVFVHDAVAWRALVSLDDLVTAATPDGCAAAYLDALTKRCQEWAWEIAEAALRDDAGGLTRACGTAGALGCGRPTGR